MANADSMWTKADKKVQVIAAKQPAMGNIRQSHSQRRMNGTTVRLANTARQNAMQIARLSTGMSIKAGLLANKPLVLHRTAAKRMRRRPVMPAILIRCKRRSKGERDPIDQIGVPIAPSSIEHKLNGRCGKIVFRSVPAKEARTAISRRRTTLMTAKLVAE
jgi:hypothetical protein